jgi:hypothetical protein
VIVATKTAEELRAARADLIKSIHELAEEVSPVVSESGRNEKKIARLLARSAEMLNLGNLSIEAAHEDLTRETAKLTAATKRLTFASYVLIGATVLLASVKVWEVVAH